MWIRLNNELVNLDLSLIKRICFDSANLQEAVIIFLKHDDSGYLEIHYDNRQLAEKDFAYLEDLLIKKETNPKDNKYSHLDAWERNSK